jgi:uncharacterized membrane protein
VIDFLYSIFSAIGFTEPLHPPITHMPIGLTVGALLFFLVAIIFKKNKFILTARHASILAFIFIFPTIILGIFDWIHFYHAAFITPIIIKMILAGVLIIVLGTGIMLGSEIKLYSWIMTVLYAIAFIAVLGLGYFGSGLIYGRGLEKQTTGITKEVKAGSTVFSSNCMACHAGGGNSVDPDYPLKTSQKLVNKTVFIEFIRNPILQDGSKGIMPSFSEQEIDKKEAESLYSYIEEMVSQQWK